MIPKLKLLSATVGLFALVSFSGFSQIKTIDNRDSSSKVENSTGQGSEWKEQVPTSIGWRTVRPGMTVDELNSAMPGENFRTKKMKYTDGTRGQQTSLKKKVKIDGLDYKVSFDFDSAGHLLSIAFLCNSKVRKESFSNVVASFTGLLGDPNGKETNSSLDGSQNLISWTWKQANSVLSVLSGTLKQGIFVVGRLVIVSMYYEKQR